MLSRMMIAVSSLSGGARGQAARPLGEVSRLRAMRTATDRTRESLPPLRVAESEVTRALGRCSLPALPTWTP